MKNYEKTAKKYEEEVKYFKGFYNKKITELKKIDRNENGFEIIIFRS